MDKHFCPYCMTPTAEGETCPSCGLTAGNYVPAPHHLPPGTVLLDRYLVGRVLGEGGFGITYIGCDLRLELKVAIKEYYPVDRATRNAAVSTNVTSFIGPSSKSFERGKQKFLSEARTMARMDKQQVIVGVRDFFEANNTVYIVMEYIEGTTFAELTEQRGGRIAPEELFRVIEPLFGALSALHETGLIHRDISPDNLMLENGEVRLLDFGCAREPADGNKTLTISLKHGYAPLEQYQESGQGPWTDIYALCATIYHCLTGQTPPRALDRIGEDNLVLPSKLGVPITPQQEAALLKGLRVQPNRRFQTVKELWAALYTPSADSPPAPDWKAPEQPLVAAAAAQRGETREADAEEPRQAETGKWKKLLPYGITAAVLLALVLALTLPRGEKTPAVTPEPTAAAVIAVDIEPTEAPASPEPTEAPVVAEPEKNTVTMTEWDEERFWALMADESVDAISVDVPGLDTGFAAAPEDSVITKPLTIGENSSLHPVEVEIGPGGCVEAADYAHFSARTLRLSGSGEQIRFTNPGNSGWNDVHSMIWANERANYGNILARVADSQQPSLIVGSEDTLFANAAVVTSFEELLAANDANTPIILGADITQTATDPDPAIHVPLLIPEGYTLTTFDTKGKYLPFSLCDSFVVNRGSMQGHFYMEGRGAIVNYGLFGSEATATTSGSRLYMLNRATLLNFGTAYADDWTLFTDGTALYNKGRLIACRSYFDGSAYLENTAELRVRGIGYYVPGLHLSGGALLENMGTLTVESTGQEVAFNTGGEERGVARSEGTLVNFAQIVNHGELRVDADTHLYNLWLQNGGSVTVSPKADFDPRGSVMWGSGMFALGASTQKAYAYRDSSAWTGSRREVGTAESLREALSDPAVDCVFLIGTVSLDESITVTKPLRVDGSLTLNDDAALTLDATVLELGGYGAEITASQVLMKNGAVFAHEGNASKLSIRADGALTLVDALYLGWDSPSLGYGAAVTLQGRAAMALADGRTPMSNSTLTLEDSAVYSFVNSNKTLSLNNMEIALKASAALMLGGGTAQLEGCNLTLESGAQAHLESSQTLLYGCRFAVGEGASFYVGNLPVRLSAGTVIENRGYMDIHMTEADRLQIDGGASIVNNGELYLALGMDDPQEFIRSGAIVNHSILHTDV